MADPTPGLVPTPLTAREGRALVALTSVAVPQGEVMNIPVDVEDVHRNTGLFFASLPREGRFALRGALACFEWLAMLRFGRPFSSLDPDRQTRWMMAWADSGFIPLRLVGRLLLTIVKPAHVRRRAVQVRLGHHQERLKGLDEAQPEAPIQLPPDRLFIGLEQDTEVQCEVAVIGSGAGGAIAATVLAEQGIDVVMIEDGGLFRRGTGHYDAAHNLSTLYRDGGATVAFGRPAMPVPLGRTIGGTTTINAGTCFRAPPRVLQRWVDRGLPTSADALDPFFRKVESRISVQVTPDALLGGSSRVVARGAEAIGLAHGPLLRNIKNCRMNAVCVFGCPTGAKQAMDVTAVPSAMRHGARLYAGVRAKQILVSQGRATGVRCKAHDTGATLTVRAKAVINACGTISGPPLLMDSGLRSKQLGRNLTIHPATKIVALMPEVVNGWEDTPQGYGITGMSEHGIMYEGAFVPPSYTAIAFPFAGRAFTSVMEQYPRLAMFGLMIEDEPSGRVWRGPSGRPVLTYWMNRRDIEKVRLGLEKLAEVFFAAGAERIFLPAAGIEEHSSMDSARHALAHRFDPWGLELVGFHPLGTARMSTNRADGVVNPDLESWEVKGLYVMDGSVLPSALGVNPQLTIMALATRAAEQLADALR